METVQTTNNSFVAIPAAATGIQHLGVDIQAEYRILKGMFTRDGCSRLEGATEDGLLSPLLTQLAKLISRYFRTYKESDVLDWVNFSILLQKAAPNPDQRVALETGIKCAQSAATMGVKELAVDLVDRQYSGQIMAVMAKYSSGAEVDVAFELEQLQNQRELRLKALMDEASADLLELDAATLDESGGLKFTFIEGLDRNVIGLKGGTLVSFAAAPDAGKTSFMAQMAVDFGRQMQANPEEYGECPLLWLVNEGSTSETVQRIQVAATNLTRGELGVLNRINPQVMREKLLASVPTLTTKEGKRASRIMVINIMGWSTMDIARAIRKHQAAGVIVDMVSYVRAPSARFGAANDSESQSRARTWEQLREIAVKENCVILGTSQLNRAGTEELYPSQANMEQSGIAVQGKLDVMLMMGRGEGGQRGICIRKAKRTPTGGDSNYKGELAFNGSRCYFTDGGNNMPSPDELEKKLRNYCKENGLQYNAHGGIMNSF